MTPERLVEIKRNTAEVADYIADGLVRDTSAYKDRADLLAEVERLRARAERAEREQMSYSRLADTLRANRDQLKEKLKQADEVIADLESGRTADAERSLRAEAEVERLEAALVDVQGRLADSGGQP